MSKGEEYDEDYFLRGRESGKSLYANYRWLPDLTIPMCGAIADHLGMDKGETVLDFGCARGYSVRAFRQLGYDAYGVDVSTWALENADPEARPYLEQVPINPAPLVGEWDWIVAKDVLEHVAYVEFVVANLIDCARQGLFVVVPLSKFNRGHYVVDEYERDVTHLQRLNLPTWVEMFIRPGWRVECAYRVEGVKDNYAKYERGNGFITAWRIS